MVATTECLADVSQDLRVINIHLNMLKQTSEPKPSLRGKLINRLEKSLQDVQVPSPNGFGDPMTIGTVGNELDYSWHIFDQASLEQLTYPAWPGPG